MPSRSVILLAKKPDADIREQTEKGLLPRQEWMELARALGAELVDFHSVDASKSARVRLAAKKGGLWGLAMLGTTRRREFEDIYVTGEDIGMPLAILLHSVFWHGRVTAIVHNVGTPRRRKALRLLGGRIWRNVIVLTTSQRDILVNDLGIPAEKVHRFDQWIDEEFFKPQPGVQGEYVISCGREQRDYPTLQQAAAKLPHIPFRVIASGWAYEGQRTGWAAAINVSAGNNLRVESNLPYAELRDAYARARFAVVPLLNVDYAAGVTAVCEAMAMGKAVITSDSPGLRDYAKHGETGLVVPVGDADALAKAIDELWKDPARCEAIGKKNRALAVEKLGVGRYAENVARIMQR